ncbi:type IV toxin-antitoxin system AbiEi family antitoxin domain-containing protein [Cryobacterium sp. PH31-O1]|uniref:type IV toxin-antitoxin system AbiEi family antitoxin domain-containing protein n=1 Tax=Cryobacterium sp. PH31-O1 TaxID=3046306 RepID=UPI0024BBDA37|nr:type IV toxin-antitoxin system AbiEi family antitoxin domain-containing protein [Cryobacterium sp. PH31-O1]MDJ0337057.1 type IV toxin-antitoxin system AbiEi family antitoxin domain-containing protein [Cryobacterium sp. PH31-O1]
MATIDDLPVHVFKAAVAADAGLGAGELRRFRESGAIDRIGRGLYRRADLPPANLDLIYIAARRPDATLCLTSALAHPGHH